MQTRNVSERGKQAPPRSSAMQRGSRPQTAPRANGRPQSAPRPNSQNRNGKPQASPRAGGGTRTAPRSEIPRGGSRGQATPRQAALRPNASGQAAPNRSARPQNAPIPKTAAKPKAQKAPKDPTDKLRKKKEKEKARELAKERKKDPNRIKFFSFEGRVDIPMLIITLVLLAVGITMMFSASPAYSYRDNHGDSYAYVRRQMTAAVIGLAGMAMLTMFDYRFLRYESKRLHITAAHIFLVICIILNAMCYFVGIEAQGGQKRWLQVPIIGQFQPSDFLKVALIIFMACYIQKNSDKMRTFKRGLLIPLLIMVPVAGSVIVQKHLSCLLIIAMIFAVMMFVGGVNLKEAVPIAVGFVLIVFFVVSVVQVGYFQQRIEYMDPLSDPGDQSYQNYQSALAIGSGGIWGKGFGNSSQKYYYLPEAQNDFVYAILVEEFGLVGGIFVILMFIIFIMRGLYIARKAEDKFGCLVATGITFQIGVQALLNIAVNLCCIPNTGVSLPFFSYGGTALVLQLWEMGLLLSISKRARVN